MDSGPSSRVAARRVGDPLDEATVIEPLVSARQRERVAGYADEAPVALRQRAPDGPGSWFSPTVLFSIEGSHPAACEEIFGPVVAVLPFERRDGRRASASPDALEAYTELKNVFLATGA
jgi:acyl-CoA reductase-like NAD-dependent aldehyde dehydrogenase